MAQAPGYAGIYIQNSLAPITKKRFLGKPQVQYGAALGVLAEIYEVGAVLAAHHQERMEPFARLFLGAHGEPGVLEGFFETRAQKDRERFGEDATFTQVAAAEEAERISFREDPEVLLLRMGPMMVDLEAAHTMCSEAALRGLALGSADPARVRHRFEVTNTPVPEAEWEELRRLGVVIGEQTVFTWPEYVEIQDAPLRELSRERTPDLYQQIYG